MQYVVCTKAEIHHATRITSYLNLTTDSILKYFAQCFMPIKHVLIALYMTAQ